MPPTQSVKRGDGVAGVAPEIEQGGAEIRLAGQHAGRFAGEPPVADEAFERADRRVAGLVVVNRQPVAGDQPQPRRLTLPAVDRRVRRGRDVPRSGPARGSARHRCRRRRTGASPAARRCPPAGTSNRPRSWRRPRATADSSANVALITRRFGEVNRSRSPLRVPLSRAVRFGQHHPGAVGHRVAVRRRALHPCGVEDLLLQRQRHAGQIHRPQLDAGQLRDRWSRCRR